MPSSGSKNEIRTFLTGREDVDVRMLGSGRPFVLELSNARLGMPSPEQLLDVQRRLKEVCMDHTRGPES